MLGTRKRRLTSASLGMRHRLAEVAVVTVGAIVAVPAGRVVTALHADSAAATPRQQVQLLVEATATSVKITTTRWHQKTQHIHSPHNIYTTFRFCLTDHFFSKLPHFRPGA